MGSENKKYYNKMSNVVNIDKFTNKQMVNRCIARNRIIKNSRNSKVPQCLEKQKAQRAERAGMTPVMLDS